MKKKVVALLLAILSAVNIVNITSIKTEASGVNVLSNNKNIAEAYLGKTLESKGFSSISMGKAEGESYIKYDEKEAWLLDVGQGQNKAYIDFSFDTSFKEKGTFDGSVYDIEILKSAFPSTPLLNSASVSVNFAVFHCLLFSK